MWSYVARHLDELRPAYARQAREAVGEVFDLDQLLGKLAASSSLAERAPWPQEPPGTRRSTQRAWDPSPSSLLS